jgi:hypothetical protein
METLGKPVGRAEAFVGVVAVSAPDVISFEQATKCELP